jgi:myo-inositol 2-dehydrogenase / D-chiro-inositol 1-dehydrogenase
MRPRNSIYDHFALTYTFPGGVPLSFTCIQAVPEMQDEISARVYGTEGYISTDYFGRVWIRGKEFYQGGSTGNLYTTGTEVNILEFHQAIVGEDNRNLTVAPSVRSNLTAVLGREAAYRGGEVTLEALLQERKRLEPDLQGLRS